MLTHWTLCSATQHTEDLLNPVCAGTFRAVTIVDEMADRIRDAGPMARFEEFVSRDSAMGEIAQRVMLGQSLKDVAEALQLPYAKLAQWVTEDVARSEQYARASRIWADTEARRTVAIADSLGPDATKSEIAAARVRIGARQFLAEKLDRERYGDHRKVDVDVNDGRLTGDRDTVLMETARTVLYFLAAAADAKDKQQRERVVAIESAPESVAVPRAEDPI